MQQLAQSSRENVIAADCEVTARDVERARAAAHRNDYTPRTDFRALPLCVKALNRVGVLKGTERVLIHSTLHESRGSGEQILGAQFNIRKASTLKSA